MAEDVEEECPMGTNSSRECRPERRRGPGAARPAAQGGGGA